MAISRMLLWGDANPIWDLIGTHSMTLAMAAGLLLITLAVFVMSRTKWGQARPLSKCMVLSVFAHILFMTFAYGTKLILDAPPADNQSTFKVTVFGEDSVKVPENAPASSPQPWKSFSTSSDALPLNSHLPPRASTSASVVERKSSPTPLRFKDQPSDLAFATNEPDRPQISAPPFPNQTTPIITANAPQIATGLSASKQPAIAPQPSLNSLPRPDAITSTAPPTDPARDVTVPNKLLEMNKRLQQLANVTTSKPQAAVQNQTLAANDSASSRRPRSPETPTPTIDRNRSENTPTTQSLRESSTSAAPAKPLTKNDVRFPSERGSESKRMSPRRLGDGGLIPLPYRGREIDNRLDQARRNGGTVQTEAAVEQALAWLEKHQSSDGRWDPDMLEGGRETFVANHDRRGAGARSDTGVTGLAILSFLGAGHTHLEGKYRRTVQHGLEFLLRKQNSHGSLAGDARFYAATYCHGMAMLAICEALAMTGDHRIQPFAERAVEFTVRTQHPSNGGWRYKQGDLGDMSQFGWQVMALKSAELAGLDIPSQTQVGMLTFLDACSSVSQPGLASYRPAEKVSRTMTAEAMTCRCLLDVRQAPSAEAAASTFILQELPGPGQANYYYWYYATLATFQTNSPAWQSWNEALQTALLGRQRSTGENAGSWDPDSLWGSYGGRVYSTALATLCLEVYYRYLPIYRQ